MINIDDIDFNCIPIAVIEDVKNCIANWLSSGGKPEDSYIQKQLQYLKNVEKAVRAEERKRGK